MIYRPFGKTGKLVSAIGFGGMRFEDIDTEDTCVAMLVRAAERGINYFDTAPKYFGVKSEERFGAGLRELRRRGLPYYVSSKTFESTERGIRREIERQLRRLDVEQIDFYHAWCITDLDGWRQRRSNGLIEAFRKLKEDGLIGHICISSHLIGDEIRVLLDEGVFEGVLFGYSAYNFRTREPAFDGIRRHTIGCVVMNPLGGGLIPQNPDLFGFLDAAPDRTVAQAAIQFVVAHEDVAVTLVGFGTIEHVDEAVSAVTAYPLPTATELERIKLSSATSFDGICTGCGYCVDGCPENIRIPRLMDAYNQLILRGETKQVVNRLKYHWEVPLQEAARCIECRCCEDACTQHLPIVERLEEIIAMADARA